MGDKRKRFTISDSAIKKRSRKPMTLELEAEVIKLGGDGMRVCDT
jgi:hypothetical protein